TACTVLGGFRAGRYPISMGEGKQIGAFIVALMLGGCGSTQSASLDSVRNEYLEAQVAYQECINASSGETNNPCASKRVIAETAERTYRDAMSKGLQGSR